MFWEQVRWAQDIAQPELVCRIERNDFAGAFALGSELEAHLGSQPALERVENKEEDAVAVLGRTYGQVFRGGFPVGRGFELDRFFIDRTEVRNAEYQEFVESDGYQREEFWEEPFVDPDGTTLTFAEAVGRFVASTARPASAAWIAGRYPDGEGSHPVDL